MYGWVCMCLVCVWTHTHTEVADLTAGAHICRIFSPASGKQALLAPGMDCLPQFRARMLHG